MKIQTSLTPGAITQFLIRVVVCLVAISFLGQITLYFLPDYPFKDLFVRAFSLDEERNIPTAYSVLALLFSSILLGAIAHVKKTDSDRYTNYWKILSIIFFYLSLDEALQLHERLIVPTRSLLNVTGVLHFTWIVPMGFLVAIFVLSYIKFLLHLPRATRILFVTAGCLYVGGAIGLEMVEGVQASSVGIKNFPYAIAVTIEEFLEMVAIVIFIHGLTSYINKYLGGVNWQINLGKKQQVSESAIVDLPAIVEAENQKLRS